MKILNLYSGLGGNRRLWGNEHQITSIEYDTRIAYYYHKMYPNDEVIVGDATEYLLNSINSRNLDYDLVWYSSPCPTHSSMVKTHWGLGWNIRFPDLTKLFGPLILLKYFYPNTKVCCENVEPWYQIRIPGINRIKLGRHTFWTNLNIPKKNFPRKRLQGDRVKRRDTYCKLPIEKLIEMHHIDKNYLKQIKGSHKNHDLRGQIVRNCVDSDIGKYILDCATNKKKQTKLM